MKNKYNPSLIEPIWQSKWQKEKIYHPDIDSAKFLTDLQMGRRGSRLGSFYNLMMFPYPSAEGMHVGNMYAFTGADIYGRFKRMCGYEVFEPIGLDGFGIHSENYALKTGRHPKEQSELSEQNFYRQMKETGNAYDWDRTVETYRENYYKWTQWLFIELFKSGLAYRKKAPVNFCPGCMTVLADEQVIDTKCERCDSIVEKRNLEQWFFAITKYADSLLENIPKLNWTERVKIAQREWIGKKEGINIKYKVLNKKHEIEVFTTRPDTNFGATFIAIAPEHPLVDGITIAQQKNKVREYIDKASRKSDIERMAEGKEKTGVFTGSYAVNQLTGYKMPIWVSDFVLMGFGTGALVGVPGHDRRDFEFAKKFELEIKRVVEGGNGDRSEIVNIDQVQEDEGKMINSEFLDGMDIHKAIEKIIEHMEKKGYGKRVATYHLRDWLISRQRYWGPPIPMVYCESCAERGKSWFTSEKAEKQQESGIRNQELGKENHNSSFRIHNLGNSVGWYPVPEDQLPVKLPDIKDFKPLGTGKAPLANHPEFYETKCPECGGPARRETDVSDTFLDSAWYFFRYLATDWDDIPFPMKRDKQKEISDNKIKDSSQRLRWLPVDMYIGGAEHSVLHLLYSRFITMFLHDRGYIDFDEPFKQFYAHGLIIKDGAKMSKSKGNVVVPDEYIRKYGADALRTYLMFLGPFNQGGDFSDSGIEGMYRFLKRVWKLFQNNGVSNDKSQISNERLRMMHETIRGVTEDMENLRYNTAIAKLMTWYNFLAKQDGISREETDAYLKLFAPFAPHMTEELWQQLFKQKGKSGRGNAEKELHVSSPTLNSSIHLSSWPEFDERHLQKDLVVIAVQINGKLRATLEVSVSDARDQKKIELMAKNDKNVAKFLENDIKKAIYIPSKILNFVV